MIGSKKTLEIKILLILIIGMMIWNLTRFIILVQSWNLLQAYSDRSLLIYLISTTGVWIFLGAFLVITLWFGVKLPWFIPVIIILSYLLWQLFDRIFIQLPHGSSPIMWIINFLSLLFTIALLLSNNLRSYYYGRN